MMFEKLGVIEAKIMTPMQEIKINCTELKKDCFAE